MMITKRPQFPSPNLLLPLLLLLSTIPVQGRTVCSSSCGNIADIKSPFRLYQDPSNCGNIFYQISCENNKPILNFRSGKYIVTKIDYQQQIIRLVDVNLSNGTCNFPYRSLSMEEVMEDGMYSGVIRYNHVNFLRCSKNLTDSGYTRVPCLSRDARQVFVKITDVLFPDEVPESCVKVSVVPTIYDSSKKNLSYEEISKMMEDGFDLGWTVDCGYCKLSGGYCNLKSEKKPYRYSCDYGYGGYYTPSWLIVLNPIDLLKDVVRIVRFTSLPLIIIVFLIHNCITMQKKIKKMEEISLESQKLLSPERYSYNDIVSMTNCFRDKLGQGGFGSVFRGQLSNGCSIAVKLLETSKVSEEIFINEVAVISRIRRPNLVQLIGFSSEGSNRALLYEYMPNGSLENHVFSRRGKAQELSWEQLQEIALGTARGIEFLHRGNHEMILHLDIKPKNVLLDQIFTPKVTDFGLIKFYPKKSDYRLMISAGEGLRYMAPELISSDFGDVSSKSDVYSFGMLLLEMGIGGRNVATDSTEGFFPTWAYDRLNEGGDVEIEAATAKKLLMIGLWCTQVKAADRPSMSRVVEMLQGSVDELGMPPRPLLSTPQLVSIREPRLDSPKERLISESVERSL